MTCLALRKLNGWLQTISPNKVKPEIRNKVIQYQEECDDVLYEYWTKGVAINPRKKTTVDERTPLRDAVNMLVSKKHLMYPEAYSMIHQRFNVESIEDLAPGQITDAIEYVHRVILEGEFISRQQELPTPKLELSYPVDWFTKRCPYIAIRQEGQSHYYLDTDALMECPSPSISLLQELRAYGYDVTAVDMEIATLRHIMRHMRGVMADLCRTAEKSRYTGLSFGI